jgi:hypothetical protein
MEEIKEAFSKVKRDIDFIREDIELVKKSILGTKENLIEFCDIISEVNNKTKELDSKNKILENKILDLKLNLPLNSNKLNEKPSLDTTLDNKTNSPTEREVFETNKTNIQTHHSYISPLNTRFYGISIGNQGVQTNKQTNKQTDIRHNFSSYNQDNSPDLIEFNSQEEKSTNTFNMAENLLDSLDTLKKEIRLKFKRLTDQELMVFSTIYQLEEEFGYSDYKAISRKLNLSESSIRDYVRRLIGKGIPLDKLKVNNKEIHLSISPNLKKIATLNTILELREI